VGALAGKGKGKDEKKVIGFDEAGNTGKQEQEYPQPTQPEPVQPTDHAKTTLDDIIQASILPKPIQKEQVSIYLEPDVKKAFDRYGKVHGKGARSMLVNNFIKNAMKANGLLK
jgi:hypothetical protein